MVKKLSDIIKLTHVRKEYDDGFVALKDINLTIESGKFYSLLGPSGSGKTTILRIIAGFSEPTSGQVFFDGKDIEALGVGCFGPIDPDLTSPTYGYITTIFIEMQ